MGKMRLKLIPGKEYLFTHKRLKTFKARYVEIVRAPSSDAADEYYLKCERQIMATTKGGESFVKPHTTLLRPSLITLLQDVPEGYVEPPRESPRRPVLRPPGGIRERVRKILRTIGVK
jgi:hypothetical protein